MRFQLLPALRICKRFGERICKRRRDLGKRHCERFGYCFGYCFGNRR